MSNINNCVSYSGLVEKYVGTAYDTVKYVADNMEYVKAVGEIDDIENLTELMNEAITTTDANKAACAASETNAATSETNAAASAAAAAQSETNIGDAETTCTDAAAQTTLDVTQTQLDVTQTQSDSTQTGLDAAQTAADKAQTQADAISTNDDVLTTAANASNAEAAETGAVDAWTTFKNQYLGSSATAPTVDRDGNPLTSGDLYQDTNVTPNLMKFWDGSTWKTAYSPSEVTDHNGLTGLDSDDHLQYLTETRHGLIQGNVHGVAASDINLGNVDNTSDVNKPVSTAQQAAITLKENALSNPGTSGNVLVSTTEGVRTWEARTTPLELSNGLATKEGNLGNPNADEEILTSNLSGNRKWIGIDNILDGATNINATTLNSKSDAAFAQLAQRNNFLLPQEITATEYVSTPVNGLIFNMDNFVAHIVDATGVIHIANPTNTHDTWWSNIRTGLIVIASSVTSATWDSSFLFGDKGYPVLSTTTSTLIFYTAIENNTIYCTQWGV